MLDQFWNREFGDCPPISHYLRTSFSKRWVRFHSLEDCQRYSSNDEELQSMLARHNSLISSLTESGTTLQLLTTHYSTTPNHESLDPLVIDAGYTGLPWRSVAMHEIESDPVANYWHIFTTALKWEPNTINGVLRLVAGDQLRNVMILDPANSWLYHPYDGGADIIMPSQDDRDRLAEKHQPWLSPRPDGL